MPTSKSERTYYEILHVSPDAPLEIIRSTYRTLMQKLGHHPDLGGDAKTAAAINEAYTVLRDAERRAEYDAHLNIVTRIAEGVQEEPEPDDVAETTTCIVDPFRECIFCRSPHDHGGRIDIDACCLSCNSPLALAENQRFESASQRAVARINKRQALTLYTHWPQRRPFSGQTQDISLNGMRFSTSHELIQGQHLKIVSGMLEAIGRVSHCRSERRGWKSRCVAGVSFITIRFAHSAGGFVSRQV